MTESPNQRHPGVAHGTGLGVGMNVDGDEQQVGMPVREMDWQSQARLAREARRGDRHCHCHCHGGLAEGWWE